MSRRSFDGTPPAGAGAFFDGPQLPPAFRGDDSTPPARRRPAPNTRQLLIVAAMTLVVLGLAWPGTRVRSPGSGLVLGRDRHWGNRLPLLYGSAWKEDQTATNVVDAVLAGFRGVDTACQPQHYREDLVGEALRTLAAKHGIGREAVWLQTKFTPALHQGEDVPYDPAAPLSGPVRKSTGELGYGWGVRNSMSTQVGPGRAERPGVAQEPAGHLCGCAAAPRAPRDARADHGGLARHGAAGRTGLRDAVGDLEFT